MVAKPRAVALPMPLLLPVTNTVLPAIGLLCICCMLGDPSVGAPQTAMTIFPRACPAFR
jgi:hypothetical protein